MSNPYRLSDEDLDYIIMLNDQGDNIKLNDVKSMVFELRAAREKVVELESEVKKAWAEQKRSFELYENARDFARQLDTIVIGLRTTLQEIVDDRWYKNGFVPSGDEESRRSILIDRINEIPKLCRNALTKWVLK